METDGEGGLGSLCRRGDAIDMGRSVCDEHGLVLSVSGRLVQGQCFSLRSVLKSLFPTSRNKNRATETAAVRSETASLSCIASDIEEFGLKNVTKIVIGRIASNLIHGRVTRIQDIQTSDKQTSR